LLWFDSYRAIVVLIYCCATTVKHLRARC